MASVRSNYRDFIAAEKAEDRSPAANLLGVTKLPDPVSADAPKPAEEPGPSPVEQASQNAIKDRLAELERAEAYHQEAAQQPHPRLADDPSSPSGYDGQVPEALSVEQIISASGLPARAQTWLRANPEYISDASKNAEIQALHNTAKRMSGEEYTDAYLNKMEELLGVPAPQPTYQPVRQQPAPARYSGPPVSAPPAREAPSMITGRPTGGPVRLTQEEADLARSLGITLQEYAAQKTRYEQLKAEGVIRDGQ